jgi:putative acetyltransferase
MQWMTIRPATPADHPTLLAIWLRSVRISHTFLTEADIQALYPLVRDAALPALELYVLECDGAAIGFMGLDGAKVEAMFLLPEFCRRGGGRMLIEYARRLKGLLSVDVNEQNPEAVRFYKAVGFRVVGRSNVDSAGRPFPLLHMRELK